MSANITIVMELFYHFMVTFTLKASNRLETNIDKNKIDVIFSINVD